MVQRAFHPYRLLFGQESRNGCDKKEISISHANMDFEYGEAWKIPVKYASKIVNTVIRCVWMRVRLWRAAICKSQLCTASDDGVLYRICFLLRIFNYFAMKSLQCWTTATVRRQRWGGGGVKRPTRTIRLEFFDGVIACLQPWQDFRFQFCPLRIRQATVCGKTRCSISFDAVKFEKRGKRIWKCTGHLRGSK